ncbi:MAG TPA: polysaccharide biosynthesis tyrosine autokinase [Bacteroidota bacterium]|nr:polysaccharide biosynthesis tyrosine autokinase [Bacteroidota bacterium]
MAHPPVDPGYQIVDDGAPSASIQEYISTVLRGKRTIVFSFAFVMVVAVVYTLVSRTMYEASSVVLLNFGQRSSVTLSDQSRTSGDNKIANELGKLRSHILAEAVAQRLLDDPWLDDAKTDLAPVVRAKRTAGDTSHALATVEQVALRAARAMDFSPERESDVIRLTARSTDPREAAMLANCYAEAYQEYGVTVGRLRDKSRREFLQNQVASKRRILDSTESVLKSYMEQTGTVSLDAQALRVTQQLSQLEADRDAIDIDLQSLYKTLATYQQRLPEQEKEVGQVMKQANDPYIKLIQEQLANLQVQRDILANPTSQAGVGNEVYAEKLKAIEGQIASLQKKLDDRTASYLSNVPTGETGAIQADPATFLAQAKQKIFETQMQIQALEAKKSALSTFIQQNERDFGGIPRKSIELAKIQRARMSAEKLYLLVEERYNEAAIGEKSDIGIIDIIDNAMVPLDPVSPNVPMNLFLGLIIGLGVGFAIVFVREYMDVRVHTPEELKRKGYALLSFVGEILPPAHALPPPPATFGGRLRAMAGSAVAATREFVRPQPPPSAPVKVAHEGKEYNHTLVSLLEPFSPAAESYRRLRSKLEYAVPENRVRRIAVTSPNPGEGKTTTVANLGFAFAQAERRVLVIDADLRRPALHSMFGFDLAPGLSEILTGKATLAQAVHPGVAPGMDVLCAGTMPAGEPEILGSRHMDKFLREVGAHYEWLLIDTSPVLAVSDAAILTAMVDGAIVVVNGGLTRMLALERAVDFVTGGGGNVVGVFLNRFDALRAYGRFYGSERYGYGTHAYGRNGWNGRAKAQAEVQQHL